MGESPVITQSGHAPKVQLGCGTLLLIALIVMIFSGRGSERELKREIQELNAKIDRLEQKIDALGAESDVSPTEPDVVREAAPP
ncbi:MAG TPA: hypothetical protein VM557_03795 [Thermoanaerobaculia bacterium]|nr:hypothetical protein [Thermoanaerobaculia bacterium]